MAEKIINPEAIQLHQEARELGQQGLYPEAIFKLEEAISIEPTWAYPPYDLAFTYLLKGDCEMALVYYLKADQLEPSGFFTAKTAIYALKGEKEGKFPAGIYRAYVQIEWTDEDDEKLKIAKAITEQVPDFAPAWKELANLLEDTTERLKAIETGLSKNPDPETKGVLLLNKVAILNLEERTEEAKTLLQSILSSPDLTRRNEELARFTMKLLGGKKK